MKPEIWTSEQFVECSRDARLLFIGLLNFCDDAGIHPASPRRLKMEVYPADDFTSKNIRGMVDELLEQGLIIEYSVDNNSYWKVTGWEKHQRIDKPTFKYPPPPDDSTPPPRTLFDSSNAEWNGMEGNGKEWNGREEKTSVELESSSPPKHVILSIPLVDKSEFEITQKLIDQFSENYPAVDVPQAMRSIRAWNLANPKNRKTRNGILRHINTWLAKEQNRGGSRKSSESDVIQEFVNGGIQHG